MGAASPISRRYSGLMSEKRFGQSCHICGAAHPTDRHQSTATPEKAATDRENRAPTSAFADIENAYRTNTSEELYRKRPYHELREQNVSGWETLYAVRNRLGRARDMLEMMIAPQRSVHPEWFNMREASNGRNAELLHPDLVALLERQMEESPPDDWKPSTSFGPLMNKFGKMAARVHPELLRPYIAPEGPSKGQLTMYYAPEFFTEVRTWLETQRQKDFPAGITDNSLAATFALEIPKDRYPYNIHVLKTAEDAKKRRDYYIDRFEADLVENPQRVQAARRRTSRLISDLERSRLDQEDADF